MCDWWQGRNSSFPWQRQNCKKRRCNFFRLHFRCRGWCVTMIFTARCVFALDTWADWSSGISAQIYFKEANHHIKKAHLLPILPFERASIILVRYCHEYTMKWIKILILIQRVIADAYMPHTSECTCFWIAANLQCHNAICLINLHSLDILRYI